MTAKEESTVVPVDVGETLRRDPDVEFAVAFGSRVTGTGSPSSDLDIAVKFVDALSDQARFRKLCHLSGHAQSEDAPEIDVSDIETLPIEVAHAAVNGEFVCGSEAAFRAFENAIESEFADRRKEIEERQRDVIRRIAEEGLHG